jgi:hypothetical protein
MPPYGLNPFWMQPCPSRTLGLKHHHESNCTDGHVSGQCCECGQRSGPVGSPVAPEPVDVAARIKALGLDPDDRPVETLRDYETGQRARIAVDNFPPKVRARLKFLLWRHLKDNLS